MSLSSFFKRLIYPGINLGIRTRRKIVRYFLTDPDSRTLDVGSGNGFFASQACRRANSSRQTAPVQRQNASGTSGPGVSGGGTVLSVSFDEGQIARCNAFKPHLRCPADKLEFRVMDAEKMDQLTEQFDQILLLEVIEHLDNDLDVVAKLARRLKPGGIMHITTPDCWLGNWVGSLDRHAIGGHCRLGYTAERVERLTNAAGLDVAYQTRLGGLGSYLGRFQYAFSQMLGGSHASLVIGFMIVYPFYLLVEWIPVPPSWRMFHYVIARKRAGDA